MRVRTLRTIIWGPRFQPSRSLWRIAASTRSGVETQRIYVNLFLANCHVRDVAPASNRGRHQGATCMRFLVHVCRSSLTDIP